jgi:dCTP deaminase
MSLSDEKQRRVKLVILSAQSIRARHFKRPLVKPFHENGLAHGMSFGLDASGYVVRCDQPVVVEPLGYALGVTLEWLDIPTDLSGRLIDKSTWSRLGMIVGLGSLKPGWSGHLTLELFNFSGKRIEIKSGTPIVEIQFEVLDKPTILPYKGRYNEQPRVPVQAILKDQPRSPVTLRHAGGASPRGLELGMRKPQVVTVAQPHIIGVPDGHQGRRPR